ncbi:hypothetical protein ACQCPP_12430 [Priestia megaterium]|uniref:hypothetical protein n=1 Tax=Priestia megaterium TaxID=1404 RepID=UPI003CFBC863
MSLQAALDIVLSSMSLEQKEDIIIDIMHVIDNTKETGYTKQQAFDRIIEVLEEGGIIEK